MAHWLENPFLRFVSLDRLTRPSPLYRHLLGLQPCRSLSRRSWFFGLMALGMSGVPAFALDPAYAFLFLICSGLAVFVFVLVESFTVAKELRSCGFLQEVLLTPTPRRDLVLWLSLACVRSASPVLAGWGAVFGVWWWMQFSGIPWHLILLFPAAAVAAEIGVSRGFGFPISNTVTWPALRGFLLYVCLPMAVVILVLLGMLVISLITVR